MSTAAAAGEGGPAAPPGPASPPSYMAVASLASISSSSSSAVLAALAFTAAARCESRLSVSRPRAAAAVVVVATATAAPSDETPSPAAAAAAAGSSASAFGPGTSSGSGSGTLGHSSSRSNTIVHSEPGRTSGRRGQWAGPPEYSNTRPAPRAAALRASSSSTLAARAATVATVAVPPTDADAAVPPAVPPADADAGVAVAGSISCATMLSSKAVAMWGSPRGRSLMRAAESSSEGSRASPYADMKSAYAPPKWPWNSSRRARRSKAAAADDGKAASAPPAALPAAPLLPLLLPRSPPDRPAPLVSPALPALFSTSSGPLAAGGESEAALSNAAISVSRLQPSGSGGAGSWTRSTSPERSEQRVSKEMHRWVALEMATCCASGSASAGIGCAVSITDTWGVGHVVVDVGGGEDADARVSGVDRSDAGRGREEGDAGGERPPPPPPLPVMDGRGDAWGDGLVGSAVVVSRRAEEGLVSVAAP